MAKGQLTFTRSELFARMQVYIMDLQRFQLSPLSVNVISFMVHPAMAYELTTIQEKSEGN